MEHRVSDAVDELLRDHPPSKTDPQEFLGAQFDHGLAWVHFPEGSRRARRRPRPSAGRRRSAARRRRARPDAAQLHGHRDDGADDGCLRQRRAAAALPAYRVHVRGDLVPDVLRAGRRVRRRIARDARRARRRRVGDQRPEGLDDHGARREVGHAARPHRPRGAEAPRSHVLRARHDATRGRRAAACDR